MHLRDIESLILLISLVGLQLQLSLAAETGLKPALDDLDEFHDANQEFGEFPGEGLQDEWDEDEIFYDVEDETSANETGAENTCATSNKEVCQACCLNQGFDVPFWSITVGQCFCYVSYGEQNICKDADQSSDTCNKCCVKRGYRLSDYPSGGTDCYCSNPDYQLFESSLKPSERRSAKLMQ